MKYISQFKLFEFNRKDKQLLLSSGINDMFTVAFEFELESRDDQLTLADSDDQILLQISLDLVDELDEEGIEYTQEFLDHLRELTDLSDVDDTIEILTKLSKKSTENENYIITLYIEALEETEEWNDEVAVERRKKQEKSRMLKYGEIKVKEHLPKFYKKYKKDLKFEFDQSLNQGIEFSPKTYVVSLDKALEMINDFYNDFDKQDYWLMNTNTSIHINIGFTRPVKWNIIKGLIMVNELRKDEVPYAFKGIKDRINTSFTQSLLDYLKIEGVVKKLEKAGVLNFPSIEFVEKQLLKQLDIVIETFGIKTFALNINHIRNHNYVEYRHVGGEVDKELVIDKIMYFAYVSYMMTTDYKDKEYHKKLYKFIDNLKVPNKVYRKERDGNYE